MDYSAIDFLDDWQLINTLASAKKDILKIIGNAFIKAFWLMQEHNVDEENGWFNIGQIFCVQMAKMRSAHLKHMSTVLTKQSETLSTILKSSS